MTPISLVPPDRSDRLLPEDYLLLGTTVLLPWAFGGVDMWAYRGAGVLLIAAGCIAVWRGGLTGLGLDRDARWLVPAFLLALWGLFQVVPLPPLAIGLLSPRAHEVYAEAFPGYPAVTGNPIEAIERAALAKVPEANGVAVPGDDATLAVQAPACLSRVWRPLSLEPGTTLDLSLWYGALLVGFLVLRQRFASEWIRRVYRVALCVDVAALAVFGLIQTEWWNGYIYWIRAVMVAANPFGPYFSPTHFGGVMELGVPALLGYCAERLRSSGRGALREGAFGAALIAACVCLAATVSSASKFPVVLIAAAAGVLLVLGPRTGRARLASAGLGLALLVAGVLLSSGTYLAERFHSYLARSDTGYLLEGRVTAWRAGLRMFRDFPLTGTGFGSFGEVFMRYTPAGTSKFWNEAHNDYLEVLLEGGLVAAGLTVWLTVGFLRRAARGLRPLTQVSPAHLGLALGALALAGHALVDFNHQMPANALLFVMICAQLARAEGDEPDGLDQPEAEEAA